VPVRFIEFCAVQSILLRSSIEDLIKDEKESFSTLIKEVPKTLDPHKDHIHTSALAYVNQNVEKMEFLESEYEKTLLKALKNKTEIIKTEERPLLQVYTCIGNYIK
jgi:hypothetical protein